MDAYALVIRVALAAIFVVSAVAKMIDRAGTDEAAEAFGVPPSLRRPVVLGLPWIEAAVAAALLSGPMARAGAAVAIGLLAIFSLGISVSLAKGRRPDCNCFGRLHSAPVGPWTLVRNLLLASAAAVVAFTAGPDAGGSILDAARDLDGSGVMVAVVTLAGLGAALFALGREGSAIIAGRNPAAAVDGRPTGPAVGSPAPGFSLPRADGGRVALDELLARGKDVMLVFFSPSCAPCREIAPELARWQHEMRDKVTVAVVSRGTPEVAGASASEYGLEEVAIDDGGAVATSYGSRGTPGAVLIERSGTIGSAYAAGTPAINDLLIRAFGLAGLVAAVAEQAGAARDDEARDRAEEGVPAEELADPDAVDAQFVPIGRRGVSMAEHEGETVLIDRATGSVHVLNPTAAIVWQCLDGTGSVAEIAADIAEVFERDAGEVGPAVLEIVRRFGRQGLLEGVGSTNRPAAAQPLS